MLEDFFTIFANQSICKDLAKKKTDCMINTIQFLLYKRGRLTEYAYPPQSSP